jgi:hypothetical protein
MRAGVPSDNWTPGADIHMHECGCRSCVARWFVLTSGFIRSFLFPIRCHSRRPSQPALSKPGSLCTYSNYLLVEDRKVGDSRTSLALFALTCRAGPVWSARGWAVAPHAFGGISPRPERCMGAMQLQHASIAVFLTPRNEFDEDGKMDGARLRVAFRRLGMFPGRTPSSPRRVSSILY